MALSDDELAVVRSWVGDDPTSAYLDEIHDRTGSIDAVVFETLNTRLANYTSDPSSFSVPGLSISNTSNITALEELIERFTLSGGTGLDDEDGEGGGGLTVARFIRKDRR